MLRRLGAVLPLLAVALAPLDAAAAPSKRVFGYTQGGVMPARWDLLSDVAFFAEAMGTSGTLPTTSWLAAGKTLVDAGHMHGVRVVLTVTLFNSATGNEIHSFLSSPAAVASGTRAIVDAVKANGADGVDIDFEFVAGADKALFTSFIQGLASAMHTALPKSDVSIAMPSEAYPGYDIAALGAAADTLMIMAYDYHWSTSDPGPVAPLHSSTMWGATLSQEASIALFKGKVPQATKLLVGMPLYGYSYHATSSTIPGTHVPGTSATALVYKSTEVLGPMHGRKWDMASSTPYYEYQDVDAGGAWRQVFYDDAESLALKIDQANADVDGIGLWALGYESPTFWAMLDSKVGAGANDAGADGGGDAAIDAGFGDDGGLHSPGGDGVVAAASTADSGGCAVARLPSSRPSLWFVGLAIVAARRRRLTDKA